MFKWHYIMCFLDVCHVFALQVLCLEKSLEEMLTRVDEFVGMLDMIRNDTSQVVNENLPDLKSTHGAEVHSHSRSRAPERRISFPRWLLKLERVTSSGVRIIVTLALSDP